MWVRPPPRAHSEQGNGAKNMKAEENKEDTISPVERLAVQPEGGATANATGDQSQTQDEVFIRRHILEPTPSILSRDTG